MYRFLALLTKHPRKIVAFWLIVVGGLSTQIPQIRVDLGLEAFYHKDSPQLKTLDKFRQTFGREEFTVVLIDSERPNGIFEKDFLNTLAKGHKLLEKVENVDEVGSLYNSWHIDSPGGDLKIGSMKKRWNESGTPQFATKIAKGVKLDYNLLSPNERFATILVRPVDQVENDGTPNPFGEPENYALVNEIRSTMNQFQKDGFKVYYTGQPVVMAALYESTIYDTLMFSIASGICIALILFLMERRVSAVILPSLVVYAALLAVMGVMAMTSTAISSTFQIIPVLLFLIGVGDSVHFLNYFYKFHNKGMELKSAIHASLEKSTLPMFLTTLTTMGGFLSFTTSDIQSIKDLGIFSAVGVLIAFFATVSLLPALLMIVRIKSSKSHSINFRLRSKFGDLYDFCGRNRLPIVAVAACSLTSAIYLSSHVRFFHDAFAWFPKGHEVRDHRIVANDGLKATNSFDIMIDTDTRDGALDPEFIQKVSDFQESISTLKQGNTEVFFSMSFVDLLKPVHKGLGQTTDLPTSYMMASQEMLLLDMGSQGKLSQLIDQDRQIIRINVRTNWNDANDFSGFLEKTREISDRYFGEKAVITGSGAMISDAIALLTHTFIESYTISAIIVTILMWLVLQNVFLLLISMIANFTPIILGIAVMGIFDITVNLATVMVGGMAMGLVVDDTIHLLHHFKISLSKGMPKGPALRLAMDQVGPALVITTISLCGGLATLAFSSLDHIRSFGIVLCCTILFAIIIDLMLIPALIASKSDSTTPETQSSLRQP